MTVISSSKDVATLTLTIVAEFDAPPSRVWGVWEDPRKLERWWGPPTWPATFTRHEFTPGGESRYYMTGPEGEKSRGWWRIEAIDKPHRIDFLNGLAGEVGEPVPGTEQMPTYTLFSAADGGDGTRMTVVTTFTSVEQFGCPPQCLRVSVHDLLPAALLLRDQCRPLQHGHVFLDGGEAHRVPAREPGHRLALPHRQGEDVAPRRIRQRLEDAVGLVARKLIYNHLVVDYVRQEPCATPRPHSLDEMQTQSQTHLPERIYGDSRA